MTGLLNPESSKFHHFFLGGIIFAVNLQRGGVAHMGSRLCFSPFFFFFFPSFFFGSREVHRPPQKESPTKKKRYTSTLLIEGGTPSFPTGLSRLARVTDSAPTSLKNALLAICFGARINSLQLTSPLRINIAKIKPHDKGTRGESLTRASDPEPPP